ncbi:MarR family winged helix-turn-helix transcriptional regulator [Tannockella kyphosi]|uniref:MarR family winged helix-turn-helix transcriptional regulator n=1 Tax=Tannockella kyphosi TaxID=2899121 RepID=UPI00201115DB|nr:MarR family transcriptional regulator [Tannockella kyphosi]
MLNRDIINREVINELLVHLFNEILDIEQVFMKDRGIKDLSVIEVHLLGLISSIPTPTMSSIAKKATLTNGTVTTAIKKLEEKNCVERIKDKHDKRIIRVMVTSKGANACRVHQAFHDEMIGSICEDTDSLQDEHLIESLRKLCYFFEEIRDKLK